MSNNKDSVLHQVRLIQAQVFAAIEEANAGVPTERRVTPGSALTAVKRSLSATRNLPFEVREFQAMRELSAFINLVQKNTFSDTFANHTDLLPISHPASTRVHGLTASALVEARLRWILSDTRISEQARPLLASIFTASSDSVEYKYAMTRLTTLPSGSYPLEALVAAFGDGNSYLARRARAMLQRRDRKGRFAFQGGGMSALVERANGQVQRLTGRVVSQSEDGNNVRIQLPNGRLVDVPVDGGEFIKAVLGKNKDGFSGVEAKHKVGDLIINEEDLQFFDAPHGFRKDTSYTGPGVKFTDDEYDVVKNGKDFAIARRENGQSLGNVDNWADAQKMIYDDEPVADAEAGREPIARLDQEQIDRMYDPNFDPKEILTPEGADLGKGSEADVSAAPGEFEYKYPEGAYQLPQDVKHVSGFNDPVNGSSDFTDDPAELAQKFETNALVNALREALIPDQASKANGEGNLKFDKKEPVPAEAIYLALQEKGVNAKQEVAKIYDAANGDKKNQEALARLEGAPESKTGKKATLPSISRNTPVATLEKLETKPTNSGSKDGEVSPNGDWVWSDPGVNFVGKKAAWNLTQQGAEKAINDLIEAKPTEPGTTKFPETAQRSPKGAWVWSNGEWVAHLDGINEAKNIIDSGIKSEDSSALEEQPTKPPAAAMRKGQVSPGGDWKWYPPVRMGGNQQLPGHWGLTEKGVAKLPPKEVKTPPVALEPVLPDEIGGGWEPDIDTQGGKNAPMYKKTINGSNFIFRQEEGGWIPLRVVNGERRLLSNYDNEDILQNADADDFENKVAFIQDNMQKAYRQSLETDLKINNFDQKVIDLVQDGKADEIIAAIKADPVYKELEDKYQDYLNDAGGLPGVMKAVVALGKINDNLDQIRDFNNPATPTDEPDVADLVDEVKGGIPTSSEIQAMLDGEGIGSDDNISGDAPSEVLPKALQEEKAVNIPDDIQKAVAQLEEFDNVAKDIIENPGTGMEEKEQGRVLSAFVSLGLAKEALDRAIANLNDRMPFVYAMDSAIWQIGSAIETLEVEDVRSPEVLELRDRLKSFQKQLAEAKFNNIKDAPEAKINIDDVIENMLLGGEPEVAVEDLIARVIPIEEDAPEAAAPPAGPPDNPPAPGGAPGSGPGSGSGPNSGPTPGPEPTPPASRGRRVRNNNVAANRRWQARFGIKPPVFYKKNRGMFYDINGVPVNVGDKVTHNNPDKDEKYGEGVVISRIPNLGRWRLGRGGEQVKVDYASYVWVQFANGKKAKLATRMLINKNPDAVENPANEVKPMRDAEMPPPDVYIEDWKKFGKALEEFGVVPGKDARGNEGFQADAGNAQQMVISKDADGNYAVYLKEENIWRNRQVEPLFVTKNLPEAANYFIAEVHNRRYQTDFPPNPVWMGEKAPTSAPNPETNVVDVPEADAVSNAGLPNVVNIDTNGKFEDLQKQIQDAIDNGQQIAFNYKGEDRLVTPKRIWTNPKNGNINLDAVGEDGFKVYTIVNMENAENPIEATPIPEPTPIPEDVAPEVSDKPFLEKISLEDQMANARAEFLRLGDLIADKAAEGIGPSDPEFAKLDELRSALINRMRDFAEQIKQRDAVPSRDPQERMDALKSEYKALGNEILDLEISSTPDQNAIDEKRNRMNEIAREMKDVKAQIDSQKSAPVSEVPQAPEAEGNPEPINEDNSSNFSPSDFEGDPGWTEGPDGMATNENGEIVDYAQNAGWFAVVRDLAGVSKSLGWFRSRKEAVTAAKKNREVVAPKSPKANSGWKAEDVDAINELFPTDIEENVLFSDNGLPEFHGGDDRNNYNDVIIELPFRGPNNYYQVVGIKQPDGKYRIFQVQGEDLGNSRWIANVIEQYLPVDNNIDLVNRMVDAYRMLEAEINDGEDLNDFFKNDDGYFDAEGKFYQRVGGVLNENPLSEKPAEPVNFGIPEKEETAAPEAGEVPASDPSAFVGLGDALYIYDPANAEKHLRNAIADKRNVVFRYKGTDRALIPLSIWTNPKNGNVNLYAEDENGDRKNYTISKIEKVERIEKAKVAKPEVAKPAVAPEVAPEVNESPEIIIPEAPVPGVIGLKTAKARAKAVAERMKKLPVPDGEKLGIDQKTVNYYLEKIQEILNPDGADRRRDKGLNLALDEAIRVITYFGWYDEMAELTAIRQRKQNLGLRPIATELKDKIQALKDQFIPYVELRTAIKDAVPRWERGSHLENLRGAINKIVMYPDPYNYNYRNGVKGAQDAIKGLLENDKIKANPELVAKIQEYGAYIDALSDLPELPKRKPVGGGNAAEAIAGLQGALDDLAGLSYEDLQNGSGDWKYVKSLSAGINQLVLIENRKTGQRVIVKYDNDASRLVNGVNLANGIRAEEMVAQIYRDLGFASPILRQLNPEMTNIEHRGVGIMEFADDGFLGLENFKVAHNAYGVYNNINMIMPEYQAEILDFLVANGIVGNTDRHKGNFMFGQDPQTGLWRLVPIDNGLALFNGGFNQAENAYPDALALRPDYVIRGRHGNRNGAYELGKQYIREIGKDRARSQIEEFAKRMKARAEVLNLVDDRAAGYIGERADWILENIDKYIDTILGM